MIDATKDLAGCGLIELFIEWGRKNLAPGTVANYDRHLRRFAAAVSQVPIKDLKKFHATSWENRFHPLQAVKRLFSWSVTDAEVLERSPFENVRLPALGQRKRILTPKEAVRMLRTASPPFRRYLIALRESVARPQEIRAATWDHVFPKLDRIELVKHLPTGRCRLIFDEYKARKRRSDPSAPRIIPLPPRLGRMLARLLIGRPDAHGSIFRNTIGRPWTNNAIRCQMRHLRKRLRIVPDHRGERIVCYTLRHTSATEACSLGMRDRMLADIMGHTSTRTTARYLHLSQDHLTTAMIDLHKKRRERRFNDPFCP